MNPYKWDIFVVSSFCVFVNTDYEYSTRENLLS